jgi:hypothetical protein
MIVHTTKKWIAKFIIFMMFFYLAAPADMLAGKKHHGAKLVITKLDGQEIRGELLKVEGTDLLLLLSSETGEKISIDEIKMIKLKKKSIFWPVAGITYAISVIGVGILAQEQDVWTFGEGAMIFGIKYGILFAIVCGGIAQTARGKYKKFKVESENPARIKRVLEYLKTKARY